MSLNKAHKGEKINNSNAFTIVSVLDVYVSSLRREGLASYKFYFSENRPAVVPYKGFTWGHAMPIIDEVTDESILMRFGDMQNLTFLKLS